MKAMLWKILRKLIAILLGILLGCALLAIMIWMIPGLRNKAVRSWLAPKLVLWYNRARPGLNVRNSDWCLKKLAGTNAQFAPVPDSVESTTGCALDHVVFMSQSYIPYNHQTLMTCTLASAMYEYEKRVVQPQARKYFKQPVVKILHVGTYNCRTMRGYSQLLSEHAYANAIDITGFQLQDGTIISVKRDWNDGGNAGRFLHAVAKKACGKFRNVLTPNYNALHHDHFHFDQGLVKRCGY
jgi:hypothetical protein